MAWQTEKKPAESRQVKQMNKKICTANYYNCINQRSYGSRQVRCNWRREPFDYHYYDKT